MLTLINSECTVREFTMHVLKVHVFTVHKIDTKNVIINAVFHSVFIQLSIIKLF